jgi:hypothetical protein
VYRSHSPEAAEPVRELLAERPRQRRRQAIHRPQTLWRYILTAAAVLVAVSVVGLWVLLLGLMGRQTAAPQPAPTAAAQTQSTIAASPPPPAPPAPTAQPGLGPLRFTSRVVEPKYVVVQGDTLGSISARFGTTIEALQSINNLADRNVLSVGQRLVIPNQE